MSEEQKSVIVKREEEILKFWQENNIFEKSLQKPAPKGNFVFYDGPPFATGLPHYGHLLPGTVKDIIPRFKTMQGYTVRRVWGWDCHGLPIENLIQKELGIATKKEIEEYGIEKFNEAARASVFRYEDEWKKIIPRTGRWVDMDNAYTTMDQSFTESVWWGFKELHKKGLVYEDFKSMHVSPLLETPLSNFEVNQNYKDIEDISIYAKFELEDEPGTFLLAWTTTPWTLPGNVALAIGEDIEYVQAKKDGESYIVAKELVSKVLKEEYEIVGELKGRDLVGKTYKPIFDYYSKDETLENRANGWKIYAGDFVTTEDGTGIVHIAPAFGEDDLNLGRKNNLPFIQHVNIDGTIKPEVTELVGRQAKPKSTDEEPKKHQETDIEILKLLAHKGLLFAKEKYTHSYPHCWRTDAPLLNYAMSSWFIKVTDLKNKLVSENKKVNWTPEDIRDGRFGNWLLGARDWAVSRNRFWGAPMPIWQSEDGKDVEIIGSIEELQEKVPDQITDIYLMRHAESEKNILDVYDYDLERYGLTEKGIAQAKESGRQLKGQVDVIVASPVRRARETAEIVAEELGLEVEIHDGLKELDVGTWNNRRPKDIPERKDFFKLSSEEQYITHRGGGETWKEAEERTYDAIKHCLEKHVGKKILFVSHGGNIVYAQKTLNRWPLKRAQHMLLDEGTHPHAISVHIKIDLNTKKAFDFHRPYIDSLVWENEAGKKMKRVPYVFDTWIDSGSMSFAQMHYPFENKDTFLSDHYPADFIAESVDQTRGWFYTLLVQGVGLFDKVPYKNVAVTGLILAEDGRKMSKSLKNYPEVSEVLDTYGADAMRYYLMSSPAVKAEQLAFSEKGVDEVVKKIILRLKNVQSFFEMYQDRPKTKDQNTKVEQSHSTHILDQWVLLRLDELTEEVTQSLEKYEIDRATRPFGDFVDDLSTWYLRRSRDRFKGSDEVDKKQAVETLEHVLREVSKLLAPFMPFLAEDMYMSLRNENDPESVHLEKWPTAVGRLTKKGYFWNDMFGGEKNTVLDDMKEIRALISSALEERARKGMKVRQPLKELKVKNEKLKEKQALLDLVKDEVNVKYITFDTGIETESALDFELTPELRAEGVARDIVRGIQDMRKKTKLVPEDSIVVTIGGVKDVVTAVQTYQKYVEEQVNAHSIEFKDAEGEIVKTDLGEATIAIEKKGVSFTCDQSKM